MGLYVPSGSNTLQSEPLWKTTDGGLVVPNGYMSTHSSRTKTNLNEVKAAVQEIETFYASEGLTLAPTCDLARMITHTKNLTSDFGNYQDLFHTLHLSRIADALLTLCDVVDRKRYLKTLGNGTLDFFSHTQSHTKDIFWEVELFSKLRSHCPATFLKDPPDIIVQFSGGTLGIACKKIYSENNIAKIASEAVHQVEGDFDIGIAAFNIDDCMIIDDNVVPEHSILQAHNEREALNRLGQGLEGFLRRHQHHFRKYIKPPGRIVSVLVSATVIADVRDGTVQFNNVTSTLGWADPELPENKKQLLQQFYDIIRSRLTHT